MHNLQFLRVMKTLEKDQDTLISQLSEAAGWVVTHYTEDMAPEAIQ